jgi:hypothetical protein
MTIVEKMIQTARLATCSEPGCTREVLCDVHATFTVCIAIADMGDGA